MGRVDGKVALVTGAARGQGRAHAVELAREGADIVVLDLCDELPYAEYPSATEEDLAETVRLVKEHGRGIVARKGDVRNPADVDAVVAEGVERFGYIDVAVINHGIAVIRRSWEMLEEEWSTVMDINLTGAWRVAKAVIPQMIDADRGGSIMFTTSGIATRGVGNFGAYSATKTGLMGLCREMAIELGPHGIRVNTLHITNTMTNMMDNESVWKLYTPHMEGAPLEDRRAVMMATQQQFHMLSVPFLQPEDVAKGVLFLASDDSKMVTGSPFRVDAGFASK